MGRYTVKETGETVNLLLHARQDRYLGGPPNYKYHQSGCILSLVEGSPWKGQVAGSIPVTLTDGILI